jgi:arylesterase/paraoxonase
MAELFRETSPGHFTHTRTWSHPLFLSPNDLVAVSPSQFYVANDKPSGGGLAAVLQQLGIGGSPLTYVDDAQVRVVKDDIASGGGVNVSADGRRLYVAETAAQRIRVLERDTFSGDVTDLARVDVVSSPDNVDVAADGSLWIGAHANTLKLIQHFAAEAPAPSQVIRVMLGADGQAKSIEDIYLDDGRQFSASSVGVNYDNLVLIGSITERKVMVCTME